MKKTLLFGMAALLLAGISSCSSDDILVQEPSKPLDKDQTFFANINIRSTESMSRATDPQEVTDQDEVIDPNYKYDPSTDPGFNAGTEQENKVKTIFLIFYDEDGNRVSTTQVRKDNGDQDDGRNYSENSLYKGVVQIDVKHGQKVPAYVMCFINPITSMNFEINPSFATLTELQKTTRPMIMDEEESYFAMSKSVYYGINRAKPNSSTYEKIIATPIPEGQLFTNLDDARKAVAGTDGADKVIDIYVERYAAKVNFLVDNGSNNIQPLTIHGAEGTGAADATLKFVPEYWAVNAYESDTYICKSFLNESLTEDMSYEIMNNALGGDKAWWWNNPDLHRCYWAQTPGYYKQRYPRVADDLTDFEEDETGEGYALGYYSYNDLVENNTGKLNAKSRPVVLGQQSTIYARENTVSGKALRNAYADPMASPKAAVASAILVGHYTIGDKTLTEDETFYIMGNATNGYTYFKDDDDMIAWFVNTTIRFAKTPTGELFYNYGIDKFGFIDSEENNVYKDYFIVAHPSKEVRHLDEENPAVVDSRFVTIQLNKEKVLAEGAPTLYAYLDGKYQAVTEKNFARVNQQMYYQAGSVQGFKGGKAYFNIPIKHLGFYRDENPNANKMGTEKDFKWDQVQSGDFGLVRNHIYTIEVQTIKGLGNGIPNFDDPIVPPTDPNEYFIGARIIVLNWAVVPTQKVDL